MMNIEPWLCSVYRCGWLPAWKWPFWFIRPILLECVSMMQSFDKKNNCTKSQIKSRKLMRVSNALNIQYYGKCIPRHLFTKRYLPAAIVNQFSFCMCTECLTAYTHTNTWERERNNNNQRNITEERKKKKSVCVHCPFHRI